MSTNEANITITRNKGKLASVSVLMPIWSKPSDQGKIIVKLPLLGIETFAKDEADTEKAIEEAIESFCLVAEKLGQGLEKELQALDWKLVDIESGDQVLGYDAGDPDSLIERLIQTGENYVNKKLEIAA